MRKSPHSVVLPDLFDEGDIFLRVTDRNFFEQSLIAIKQGVESVALISNQSSLIDHYGQILIGRLRKFKNLRIEVYFPSNTETLINRFNQILSKLSLAEAKGIDAVDGPDRILVIHDFSGMNDKEIQLMGRIINDFPGAKTRLVLLLDLSQPQVEPERLNFLGKNLIKWVIEPPTKSQKNDLRKLSASSGLEQQVNDLLIKLGNYEDEEEIKKNRDVSVPKAPSENKKEIEYREKANGNKNLAIEEYSPPRGIPLFLATIIVTVAVLTVLYVDEIASYVGKVINSETAANLREPDIELINIEESAEITLDDVAKITDEPEPAKTPVSITNEAQLSSGDSPTDNSIAEQEKELGETAEVISASDKRSLGASGGTNDFIDGFRDSDWLLQHVAMTTYGDARNWREKHTALVGALIIPITSGDIETRRYVVVSGPYSSKQEAIDFLKVPGVPADHYLRTVRSLKAVIPATLLD